MNEISIELLSNVIGGAQKSRTPLGGKSLVTNKSYGQCFGDAAMAANKLNPQMILQDREGNPNISDVVPVGGGRPQGQVSWSPSVNGAGNCESWME